MKGGKLTQQGALSQLTYFTKLSKISRGRPHQAVLQTRKASKCLHQPKTIYSEEAMQERLYETCSTPKHNQMQRFYTKRSRGRSSMSLLQGKISIITIAHDSCENHLFSHLLFYLPNFKIFYKANYKLSTINSF